MRPMPMGAGAVLIGACLALATPHAATAQSGESDAVAGFESAGALLSKCRQNSSYAKNFCYAYLAAVADSSRSYRVWIGSGDPCLPQGLTLGKLADTFEAYLIANPSLTTAQAASVIVASLQESFPCPAATPLPMPQPVVPPPETALPDTVQTAAPRASEAPAPSPRGTKRTYRRARAKR